MLAYELTHCDIGGGAGFYLPTDDLKAQRSLWVIWQHRLLRQAGAKFAGTSAATASLATLIAPRTAPVGWIGHGR